MEDLKDQDLLLSKYNRFYDFCSSVFGIENQNKDELDHLMNFRKTIMDNNMLIDSSSFILNQHKQGKKILAEGANGALLDIDHGTYPYVTSSNTIAGGIASGLGVPPTIIENIIGTVKAYTTRVGEGPFPTELNSALGEEIRTKGGEFGTTTGRPRRCGWLDLEILRKSARLNGYTSILITKLDILSGIPKLSVKLENDEWVHFEGWEEDISGVRKYEDLPQNAQKYLQFVEEYLETRISWVGVGPERDAIIQIEN
jgi:adenylosuccinate synthase